MISRRTESFRKQLDALPYDVRKQAKDTYRAWLRNPEHPSLRFKKVHMGENVWSVRITQDYRAVGVKAQDKMVSFWIGSHAEYDRLLRK